MYADVEILLRGCDRCAEDPSALLRRHRNQVRSGSKPLPDKVDVTPQIVDLIGKVHWYPNFAHRCVDVLKLGLLGAQM